MKGCKVYSVKCMVKGIIFLSIFIFQFSLYSCRPRGILHSWEMRKVLVDLHKTDAMLLHAGLTRDEEARQMYYGLVMEKHGITQAEFDSSLVWYTAHPQLFDKIYPRVINDLQAQEEAFIAYHVAELNLEPNTPESSEVSEQRPFTKADLDSVLWVTQHGYEHYWNNRPVSVPFPLLH